MENAIITPTLMQKKYIKYRTFTVLKYKYYISINIIC